MTRQTTPAPGTGQRLNLNLGGTDNSINPKNFNNYNHLKTLQTIAEKWVNHGFYSTPDRALRALIRGEL